MVDPEMWIGNGKTEFSWMEVAFSWASHTYFRRYTGFLFRISFNDLQQAFLINGWSFKFLFVVKHHAFFDWLQ